MKRLLVGSSIVMAYSTLAVDLDYKGELRLRSQNREHLHSTADRRNLLEFRARPTFNIGLKNNLSMKFSPQATKLYGEEISTSNDESDRTRLSSGDQYHSGVDLFEGYIESKGDFVSYRIGRQKLNYGDHVILGTRNWTNGGLSFDAVKLMFDVGEGQIDLAYSKISDSNTSNFAEDDSDLFILYYKIKQEKDFNLDTYFINYNERKIEEIQSYGVRAKGSLGNFGYRTEGILQMNTSAPGSEHSMDLEASYKINSFSPYLGWSQSTAEYDHLFTNRHLYNGIIDIVGRQNLESIYAGLNFKLKEAWDFKFKWMNFKQKSVGFGAYNQATSAILSGDRTKESIGNEYNLITSYKKNNYEKIILGLSLFDYGDYFSSNLGNASFLYLEYLLKF